ncbi:hypothetical protein K6V90_09445 [Cupriavidus pauculus]|uniref:hypothetical protein n=1 Tax=Cupriavidus pauculus TaxID=82633 RepID=UPI001C93650B|nr:hypothetical protein [Cupriavidus pauculus]MBY4730755.1 hypothetical protein [Cupriavidus pauculus]
MKTAIYIEDGVVQLVLTPQSEFERSAIGSFSKKTLGVQIFNGEFYDCRGGWARQKAHYPNTYGYSASENDCSLILRIETAKEGE